MISNSTKSTHFSVHDSVEVKIYNSITLHFIGLLVIVVLEMIMCFIKLIYGVNPIENDMKKYEFILLFSAIVS